MKVKVQNHFQRAGARPSRQRSLIRDAARGLAQQMFFWGCDACHPEGNLLERSGLRRIERAEQHGEGSSRYWVNWRRGVVELHSFCAGWYPDNPVRTGAVFIRSQERLLSCTGGEPLVPGRYQNSRFGRGGTDDLLAAIPALLAWVCHHEEQVFQLAGAGYRQKCWTRYLSKPGARPWLPPDEAARWFREFLQAPSSVSRPREIQRRTRPAVMPKSPATGRNHLTGKFRP